jgi:hypothetical protein
MRKIYQLWMFVAFIATTPMLTSNTAQAQPCVNTAAGTNCSRSGTFAGEILPACGTFVAVSPYSPGTYFRIPVLQGGCYTISNCGTTLDTQIGAFQGSATTGPFAYNDDNGPECTGTAASIVMVPAFTDYANIDVRQYNCLAAGSASVTVNVRQNNNLVVTSSSADMCQGQTRTLTATPVRVVTSPQPGSGDVGTFSGTGVAGTTFTAPTPAGAAAGYNVTYTFGYCASSQSITVYRNPTVANAGPAQTVCAATTTLAANSPAVGTGVWTVVSGTATVTTTNSPTSTVTGLVAGASATLRWTISNGACTASTSDVIITRSATPTTAAAGPAQSVCGTSATMAANTPTSGTGAWSVVTGSATITTPGSPTTTITAIPTGTSVTLRWTISSGACPASTSDVTITSVTSPTVANAGSNQTICGTSASISANNPTVGTGLWSVVTGTATITAPTAASTTVTGIPQGSTVTLRWTISNAPCPASTSTINIISVSSPTVASAGPAQTICGSSTTLAANTPTVGTGAWSVLAGTGTVTAPSSPTSTVTGIPAGTSLTLRWTISNAPCPPTTSDVIITNVTPPTTANAGPAQTICGTTTTMAANTPTSGTGAWSIVTGTATITTPSAPNTGITGIVQGTSVTLRWTISNAPCPPSTNDVTITSVSSPTVANAGPSQTLCGATTTLAANTPTVGTGAWTVLSGTGTVTTPGSPTSGVTGIPAGTSLTLRWTISNAPCPPTTSDVIITRVNPPSLANAGPPQTICSATATMAANAPAIGAGAWTVVTGTGTITTPSSPTTTVTGIPAGTSVTLRWTVSNAPCPPSANDVVITRINEPTTASAGPDQAICATSATMAANTPTVGTGAWTLIGGSGTIASGTSPTTTISNIGIGPNTFVWSISNGICPVSSDTVVINRSDVPTTAQAGPNQLICDSVASLAGNAPSVGNGLWVIVSGSGTVLAPGSPTSTLSGVGIGTTVLAWVITNGSCPASTDTVVVTRNALPAAPGVTGPLDICAGASTTLIATSAEASPSYTWWSAPVGGSSLSAVALFTTPNLTTTTTYYVEVLNGATGCLSVRQPVVVTVNALPTPNLGADTSFCANDSLCLTPGTYAGYLWSNGDSLATVCFTAGGSESVLVTDSNGCQASDTIALTTLAVPVVNLGPDPSLCSQDSLSIGVAPTAGSTYLWSNGDTTSMIMVLGTASTYTLTCTDSLGCSGSDDISTTVTPDPTAAFIADTSGCPIVAFTNQSTNSTSYEWDFADGGTSAQLNPTHNYQAAGNGTYNVRLISTGVCGSDTAIVPVVLSCIVGIENPYQVEIAVYPNPNNGTFKVRLSGLEDDAILRIFDLNGKQVFRRDLNSRGDFEESLRIETAVGTYILKLQVGGQVITKRIVIE